MDMIAFFNLSIIPLNYIKPLVHTLELNIYLKEIYLLT